MEYIIAQAGGRGSRLGSLTENKPKALVTVNGAPLLLHLIRLHPEARFIVIADYKWEVLSAYLACFGSAATTIVRSTSQGTCAGIGQALDLIPPGTPFGLIWSDLFFETPVFPRSSEPLAFNRIGLATDFPCRWRFGDRGFREEESQGDGVAGVFAFQSKAALEGLPEEGEICEFLQRTGVPFTPFLLEHVTEIGTRANYDEFTERFPRTRPFNEIIFREAVVEKRFRDELGRQLGVHERSWYRATAPLQWDFVPTVHAYEPHLVIERIDGNPLYAFKGNRDERAALLGAIIDKLGVIHTAFPARSPASPDNDREALVGKTRARLDRVAALIPGLEEPYFRINGRTCLNVYNRWELVESMAERYLPGQYQLIHGDPTFSNILIDTSRKRICFVDPRGFYGREPLFGDPDYDWAKLYYSLAGNYDCFNNGDFSLSLKDNEISVHIGSNGWEDLMPTFFELTGANPEKIRFLHALIWLSLPPYVWNDYDAVCAAFFNGIARMQDALDGCEAG